MLVAEKKDGQKVFAEQLSRNIKEVFFCPECKQPVILKQGHWKIPHFAHQSVQACSSFSEGETQEHLYNKAWLQAWTQDGILEAYLPELKQRPDILWKKLAIEVQCSSLSVERLIERIQTYQQYQYHSWWLLGLKLFPQKRWGQLQKACSYYSEGKGIHLWTIRDKEIWLLYQVHQHFRLGTVYHVQKWGYPKNNLTDMMQFSREEKCINQWQANDYQLFIQKKLFQREKKIYLLQKKIYSLGGNVQALPKWCYEVSQFYFYFGDQLLFLRYCYLLTKDLKTWLAYLKNLDYTWMFPLVSQKELLIKCYQECQHLCTSN